MSNKVNFLGVNLTMKWLLVFTALILTTALLFPVLLEASAEKDAAIADAEAAIDEIPDLLDMEDKYSLLKARFLVNAALDLGAVEAEIDNYDDLLTAEETMESLYRDNYMVHGLYDLPTPPVAQIEGLDFIPQFRRLERWWEDPRVNGIGFLPLGALSVSYTNIDTQRWIEYDISGRNYSHIKGYIGIDDDGVRQDYPVTFQLFGDGALIYEQVVDHGEDAFFFLVEIDIYDNLRIGWHADVTEGGFANQFVLVEPRLLVPIDQEILDAIGDAEAAIAALPAVESLEDEAAVQSARAIVDEAFDLGVDQYDRIENLDELLTAEEAITQLYHTNYAVEELEVLGDPGPGNRRFAFVDFGNDVRWTIGEYTTNWQCFAPTKTWTISLSYENEPMWGQWDISEMNYHYIEGYIGCSDAGHGSYPLTYTIYGDGEPIYELVVQHSQDPVFYRVDIEDVDILKLEIDAEETTSSYFANRPYLVMPNLLSPLDSAIGDVEAAIDSLPDPIGMEDMMLMRIVRHAVEEALDSGITEEQIGNFDAYLTAEENIAAAYNGNYMRKRLRDIRVPEADDVMNLTQFARTWNKDYWFENVRTVNGICFLPLGRISGSYNLNEPRWIEYDIGEYGFSLVKGYAGSADQTARTDYPVTFTVHADGDLIYEEVLIYGEHARFYLLDIEGVERLRFGWHADNLEGNLANRPCIVEPQFLIPINQEMLDAIGAAEAAIEELPGQVSLLDEPEIKGARSLVDEAHDLGVDDNNRIKDLDKLLTAEEKIRDLYHELYEVDYLDDLGDPGPDNRTTDRFVDFYNPERWNLASVSGHTINHRYFDPLRTFSTSVILTSSQYAQWDISDADYRFIEGYVGISDITINFAYPLDFTIYGDGEPIYEAHLEYHAPAIYYHVDLEGVDTLKIEWSAQNLSPTNFANFPAIVMPTLYHSPRTEYAIAEAEAAIDDLPGVITGDHKEEVRAARCAVNNAIAIGVQESEIGNIDVLEAAEATLLLSQLIADAISAIDALPQPEDVTDDDRPAAVAARNLVDEALALGADEEDITNLAHLEAVEEALDDIWEVTYGDVNDDGLINVEDVIMVMQSILGLIQLDDNQRLAADVNGDEQINVEDVVLIMQRVLGLIQEFPVED